MELLGAFLSALVVGIVYVAVAHHYLPASEKRAYLRDVSIGFLVVLVVGLSVLYLAT